MVRFVPGLDGTETPCKPWRPGVAQRFDRSPSPVLNHVRHAKAQQRFEPGFSLELIREDPTYPAGVLRSSSSYACRTWCNALFCQAGLRSGTLGLPLFRSVNVMPAASNAV